VSRTVKKSSQNQHVQRALKNVGAWWLLSHGRCSTLNWPNGRHSTIGESRRDLKHLLANVEM
jgi:hypothetical protein